MASSTFDPNVPAEMARLNQALLIALESADGDPESFAFYLTAPLAAWMAEGGLNEDVAMASIQLLHRLHPPLYF